MEVMHHQKVQGIICTQIVIQCANAIILAGVCLWKIRDLKTAQLVLSDQFGNTGKHAVTGKHCSLFQRWYINISHLKIEKQNGVDISW
jgi:hypothetical protein